MQWAAELRQGPRATLDPERLLETVLDRLRTGGYTYTLDPGVFGINTADEFWFDSKEGFCEHIASAFVIMMRSLDIPARIVTGYQGSMILAMFPPAWFFVMNRKIKEENEMRFETSPQPSPKERE